VSTMLTSSFWSGETLWKITCLFQPY
jgi:hypothetical protein